MQLTIDIQRKYPNSSRNLGPNLRSSSSSSRNGAAARRSDRTSHEGIYACGLSNTARTWNRHCGTNTQGFSIDRISFASLSGWSHRVRSGDSKALGTLCFSRRSVVRREIPGKVRITRRGMRCDAKLQFSTYLRLFYISKTVPGRLSA